MTRTVPAAALALIVVTLLGGCSEGACQKAESTGRPTHACYVENEEARREAEQAERELNRVEGTSRADEEAEARKEFREGWEEAEREAEFYGE